MSERSGAEIARQLVRVTEAGAMASVPWIGKDNRNAADGAAVQAMRLAFQQVDIAGVVVMGEGVKDEAPMFDHGEQVGTGSGFSLDIAVDPIDGTALVASGLPGAISVLAASSRNSLLNWQNLAYLEKLVVGPAGVGVIDIEVSAAENIRRLAVAQSTHPRNLTVAILNRDRHQDLIHDAISTGAHVEIIDQGDVIPALMCGLPNSGIDMFMGVGGSPEAIITACAIKCLGGDMQCRYWLRNDQEREASQLQQLDVHRVLQLSDLISGDRAYFAATGITDGALTAGVVETEEGIQTSSIALSADAPELLTIVSMHATD